MTPDFVLGIAKNAIEITLLLSLPILGVGLLVGLIISIFQAATQIQEMTLTFIPKVLAVVLSLFLFLPWMLQQMVHYATDIFSRIGTLQ